MSTEIVPFIRATTEPFGHFIRPGHNDHRLLCQLISEGRTAMSGVVFDPTFLKPQGELRAEVNQRRLWTVLDPLAFELSTPSGHTARRASLPWASKKPHSAKDLADERGFAFADAVAAFVKDNFFSAVLAPTHYLANGFFDSWFEVDLLLTRRLRETLDSIGCRDVPIFYPLAIPTSVFSDSRQRSSFKASLRDAPVASIWLRIHPFGGHSGHITLQRYIGACRDLHSVKKSLIAEKVGNVGLALLAFGAVSGIETGVSSGEKFDAGRLFRELKDKKGFSAHRNVYIPDLGIFLNTKDARQFFENKPFRSQYACTNTACCREGVTDSIKEPRRHFVFSRLEEVKVLGSVPSLLRADHYLNHTLKPATDKLGRVSRSNLTAKVKIKLENVQRRLEGWWQTLSELSRVEPAETFPATPERKVQSIVVRH
jgi:hypothetical protein